MSINCYCKSVCESVVNGSCKGEIEERFTEVPKCYVPLRKNPYLEGYSVKGGKLKFGFPNESVLKGNPKFYEILEQIKILYAQKNSQYAIKGDTERNFKDGAYLLKKFFKDIDNKELAYLISLLSKQYLGVIGQ